MPDLSLQKKGQRLRIYIDESDHWQGKPLDAALLETLKAQGMAGATVFRASAGFGAHSSIHTSRIEVLSTNLPIIVEVVDSPEKISAVLEVVYPMVREGLITTEDVQIIKYTHRGLNPFPADRLVSEVMTKDVLSLTPDQPVYQAWKKMLEKAVKALPVVDAAGRVLGILTNEDLFERAGLRQRLSVAIRMDTAELNQEIQTLRHSTLTVSDVMTQPAVTISENADLGSAVTGMVRTGLKRLPVVNNRGSLVGIISRLDILRVIASSPAERVHVQSKTGVIRTVKDVMRTQIPTISEADDLATIVDKFAQTDSVRLIVVDAQGKATGLISDSDVVARIQPAKRGGILNALRKSAPAPAGSETARELMSPGPLSASSDLSVFDAVKMMLAQSRKWLVVIDDTGKPIGLVDREILLEALSSIYAKS